MKKALALSAILVAIVALAAVAGFFQSQFTALQNQISNLRAENRDLQDQERRLLFQTGDFESQNDELVKQLGDLTKQLALERPLDVKIVAFSHEDQWSDYGPFFGVPRSYNRFNVTIWNNDVVALSGLMLTVETFSGDQGEGWVFSNRTDMLRAGEAREIKGEAVVPTYALEDLSFVATLKSGDVVLDEFRMPLG